MVFFFFFCLTALIHFFDFNLKVLIKCVLGETGSTPIKWKLNVKIKHICNNRGLKPFNIIISGKILPSCA